MDLLILTLKQFGTHALVGIASSLFTYHVLVSPNLETRVSNAVEPLLKAQTETLTNLINNHTHGG